MLQFKNETPFAGSLFLLPNADGVDTIVAVVKATFRLGPALGPAEEQVKVALTDSHYGDPTTTSIKVPSDVSLMKPATDVLLLGTAYAPSGHPTPWMDVSLAVGPLRKTVRVFGDRTWRATAAGRYAMTEAVSFEAMPLVWERAFGGSDVTSMGPAAEPRNPVGIGFRLPNGTKEIDGLPVPNLEDPFHPITSWKETPPPACFAPVSAHWQPRLSHAGTYDEHWQSQRAPYLPTDFDARFFQVAPPGLTVVDHLRGGERVEVCGATPSGLLQFQLPSVTPRLAFVLDGASEQRPAVLDTVIIEPDESRVILVWRATFVCDKRALHVDEVRANVARTA